MISTQFLCMRHVMVNSSQPLCAVDLEKLGAGPSGVCMRWSCTDAVRDAAVFVAHDLERLTLLKFRLPPLLDLWARLLILLQDLRTHPHHPLTLSTVTCCLMDSLACPI